MEPLDSTTSCSGEFHEHHCSFLGSTRHSLLLVLTDPPESPYLCCRLWAWPRRATPASANLESPRKQLVWSESELLERHPTAVCFAVGATGRELKPKGWIWSFPWAPPNPQACTGAEHRDHGTSRIDPLAIAHCKKSKVQTTPANDTLDLATPQALSPLPAQGWASPTSTSHVSVCMEREYQQDASDNSSLLSRGCM